jgi:hypothetical protein
MTAAAVVGIMLPPWARNLIGIKPIILNNDDQTGVCDAVALESV